MELCFGLHPIRMPDLTLGESECKITILAAPAHILLPASSPLPDELLLVSCPCGLLVHGASAFITYPSTHPTSRRRRRTQMIQMRKLVAFHPSSWPVRNVLTDPPEGWT